MKLLTLIFSILLATSAFSQGDTMYVQGRHLYSASGEKIVLRGMNAMSVWSSDRTGSWTMQEIAQTGANCVRLVWTQEYGNKQELAQLIDNCVTNKMIAIPEPHDATGKWDKIDTCINFWNDPDLFQAIERNKKWAIINVGNEIGDYSVAATQFEAEYKRAIDSLRGWGYTVPIMIDASNWGQNADILFETWKAIIAHDPLENIIFSAHSYWNTTDNYTRIAEKATNENMPIIIGEGPSITLPGSCKILDFETGLTITGENEIGWMSWSWGAANNGDCKPNFDHVVSGKFGKWETDYAISLVVDHQYSLMNTAERPASMFEDGIVPVSGLQMLPYKPELFPGDSVAISVTVAPANAADKSYYFDIIQSDSVLRFSADSTYLVAVAIGTAEVRTISKMNGVYGKSFITVLDTPETGVKYANEGTEIYPVPLNGNMLTVRFSELHSGTLKVINAAGNPIYTEQFTDRAFLTFDTENISYKGVAIIKVMLDDGTIIERLIVL